jgi:regulator of protease activity HflC (stomatin/prohibitin superfamily)
MRMVLAILIVAVIGLAVFLVIRALLRGARARSGVVDVGGSSLQLPRWLPLLGALVAVLVFMVSAVRSVPVGHALVVFNTLTGTFRIAEQGVTTVWPLITSTQLYDLRRQEYTMTKATGEGRRADWDDSLWAPTQEGLQVGVDITIWHHVDPARVAQVHQTIGPDYEEKVIRPAARSVIRLVISEYPVADVYSSKRALIQEEINRKIRELVEKDGFLIDEVVLRDVHFSEQFAQAIEAKQIAQQGAEQMKYVLEKEQREAERKVIEAQGRAKAIDTVNAALRANPNYIRYLYVDKLSDKVSVIVSDQNTIMDLKGMLARP